MNRPFEHKLIEMFNDKKFIKKLVLWHRYEKNEEVQNICKILDIAQRTVQNILDKWSKFGSIDHGNFDTKKPRLPEKTIEKIKEIQKNDRYKQYTQITNEINENADKRFKKAQATYYQVRSTLNKEFRSTFCSYQIKISEQNRLKRLSWIEKYGKYARWKFLNVVWTDEKKFEICKQNKKLKIKLLDGENKDAFSMPKMQKGGGSSMYWGAVNYNHKILLTKIHGNFDSFTYSRFLRYTAIPRITDIMGNNFIYQQDNAPPHKGETTTYLKNSSFEVLDWPSQSPDLNPIEMVWCWMEEQVKYKVFKNTTELDEFVFGLWEKLEISKIQKFIDQIPKKMEWIYNNDGVLYNP